MKTEQNESLRHRAAIHAALSDTARLTIVDTLLLGDASPSELQAILAIPSNLLAHHIKVLEDDRERDRAEEDDYRRQWKERRRRDREADERERPQPPRPRPIDDDLERRARE